MRRFAFVVLVLLAPARAHADTTIRAAPDAETARIAAEGGEEMGHPVSVTTACVELRTARGQTNRLEFLHDAEGRLTRKDDAIKDGRVGMRTRYFYDPHGRLLSMEGEYDAPSKVSWRYQYSYSASGKKEIETWFWEPRHKVSGKVVTYKNSAGLIERRDWDTDGDGRLEKVTKYRYEGARLVEEWTEEPDGKPYNWVRYFYDANGRRSSVEGTLGKEPLWREDYSYDSLGRVIGKKQYAVNNRSLVFIETEYQYCQ